MKKFITIVLLLAAAFGLLCGVVAQGATVTGNAVDSSGNVAVGYVQFKPKTDRVQSVTINGTNYTVVGYPVRADVNPTNNLFSAFLVGGYYQAYFDGDKSPLKPQLILVPPDSGSYTFNQCLDFATNLVVFYWTNPMTTGVFITNKWIGSPLVFDNSGTKTNTYGGKLTILGSRVQSAYSSATQPASAAFGNGSVASGASSIALGQSATASGQSGFAVNQGIASGFMSFAFGASSVASNDYSFVWSSVPTYVENFGGYDSYPIGSDSNGTFTVSGTAFRFLNGTIYGDGSGLSGVDPAGAAAAAVAAIHTNPLPLYFTGVASGQTLLWDTDGDPSSGGYIFNSYGDGGAHQFVMQNNGSFRADAFIGDGSGLSGVDLAGTAASEAMAATNALGSAAWASTNRFDPAGAAQAATNALASGAFNPKYVLPNFVPTNAALFQPTNNALTLLAASTLSVSNGASLTNLNASNLASGTINPARLPSNLLNNGVTNIIGWIGVLDTSDMWSGATTVEQVPWNNYLRGKRIAPSGSVWKPFTQNQFYPYTNFNITIYFNATNTGTCNIIVGNYWISADGVEYAVEQSRAFVSTNTNGRIKNILNYQLSIPPNYSNSQAVFGIYGSGATNMWFTGAKYEAY
ncbi:MAG: hypothetical protein WCH99_08850 [Verrucomicrobiota bacterium]